MLTIIIIIFYIKVVSIKVNNNTRMWEYFIFFFVNSKKFLKFLFSVYTILLIINKYHYSKNKN